MIMNYMLLTTFMLLFGYARALLSVQVDVYGAVRASVGVVTLGINATVMAYGQVRRTAGHCAAALRLSWAQLLHKNRRTGCSRTCAAQ